MIVSATQTQLFFLTSQPLRIVTMALCATLTTEPLAVLPAAEDEPSEWEPALVPTVR